MLHFARVTESELVMWLSCWDQWRPPGYRIYLDRDLGSVLQPESKKCIIARGALMGSQGL